MDTNDRRPARGQRIPKGEARMLRTLKGNHLYARIADLYAVGWTLRAIGEAFEPPRPRSTIMSWTQKGAHMTSTLPLPDITIPVLATSGPYIPQKNTSPGISDADMTTITHLAPISRKYRASMSNRHPAAISNQDLTDLCTKLYENNVTITELSRAAGVTYRAMAKRIGK